MKNKFLVVASAALVAMMSFVPAFAQGEVTLTGGSLSHTTDTISFTGFQLDGTTHTDLVGASALWTAEDATGSGAGWNMTIAATDFVKTGDITKTIPVAGFELTLLDASVLVVDGNTKPVAATALATGVALGAAQTLVSAVIDTGMGSYTLDPTFTLDVPASTYAGVYVSTVTVTINSTP